MKNTLLILALVALVTSLIGCAPPTQDAPGYSKSDFARKPKPDGYGPPTGAAPAATPPAAPGGN